MNSGGCTQSERDQVFRREHILYMLIISEIISNVSYPFSHLERLGRYAMTPHESGGDTRQGPFTELSDIAAVCATGLKGTGAAGSLYFPELLRR